MGGSLQGQSLVATGCDRSGLLRWLPLELAHACHGKLLDAFRVKHDKGRGWQLNAPERAGPGVALTESHGEWERLLLSNAQHIHNGTLLVNSVAVAQFSNASTARAAISCERLKLVSAE